MKPEIITHTCDDSQLYKIEQELHLTGFRLTTKTSEKDLLEMEYLKMPYTGSQSSFHGPRRWTIIARTKN